MTSSSIRIQLPAGLAPFTWRSESNTPPPSDLVTVDDRLTADHALQRVRRGQALLYAGDFRNAKQLLSAMARRLPEPRRTATPLEAFREERAARQREQETLSRILVALDGAYQLKLNHAPDVVEACVQVWGPPPEGSTLVSLKTLLGMMGAAEWRKKGIAVPGLKGRLHPHYGVYAPTRSDYVQLLARVPSVRGARVFDIGTGTGVLSFLLLQAGASSAIGTDVDPRAIACAEDNAHRLGLSSIYKAHPVDADLFPQGRADLIVSNPPWIPEPPKNRIDRAVFDPDNEFLIAWLKGLQEHLLAAGRGLLILSNLAELLGLRSPTWLETQIREAGLTVVQTFATEARHAKAHDPDDPLHAARSKEKVTLYTLVSAECG